MDYIFSISVVSSIFGFLARSDSRPLSLVVTSFVSLTGISYIFLQPEYFRVAEICRPMYATRAELAENRPGNMDTSAAGLALQIQ